MVPSPSPLTLYARALDHHRASRREIAVRLYLRAVLARKGLFGDEPRELLEGARSFLERRVAAPSASSDDRLGLATLHWLCGDLDRASRVISSAPSPLTSGLGELARRIRDELAVASAPGPSPSPASSSVPGGSPATGTEVGDRRVAWEHLTLERLEGRLASGGSPSSRSETDLELTLMRYGRELQSKADRLAFIANARRFVLIRAAYLARAGTEEPVRSELEAWFRQELGSTSSPPVSPDPLLRLDDPPSPPASFTPDPQGERSARSPWRKAPRPGPVRLPERTRPPDGPFRWNPVLR